MSNRRADRRFFNKRVAIFSIIELILGCVLLARLAYLQVYRSSYYTLLSDKNRIVTKQILPTRGMIMDSKGRILASNKPMHMVMLDLQKTTLSERKKIIEILLARHDLSMDAQNKINNVAKLVTNYNRYICLQQNLDWSDLSKFYVMSSKIPEISIAKSHTRSYNFPHEFSHILGYVGSPSKSDQETCSSRTLLLPMAKVGKTGIEKQYDEQLFGIAGIRHVEVNAKRQFMKDIDSIQETPGDNLSLTVNLDLQLEVYKILSKYESASCIVMDARNGEILAFVSYPGYDTNMFSKKINGKDLQECYQNPYNPMINKIIHGLYSPGSVFKMMTAIAGLKKGVITEHTRFNCSGYTFLGNHKFHCWKWKNGGHGSVDLEDALAESCDVYFYNVAKMLSPDDIAQVAHDFGFGEITGIDLPYEKSGLIPTKLWKQKTKKQKWTTGDTFNTAIGQGYVLVTPLQLAKMMAILVNGQKVITPHLNKHFAPSETPVLNYSKAHIQTILAGMDAVVNSWYGTAKNSAIDDENFNFGGKTGSSQVYRISEKARRSGKTVSDDYWKKEHAVFVGYAPVRDPRVVVAVLIEHGGGGGQTAAPVAREVFLATKKYLPEIFR